MGDLVHTLGVSRQQLRPKLIAVRVDRFCLKGTHLSRRVIIAFIAFIGSIAPFGLQALPPTAPFVERDFGISVEWALGSVAAFSLALAVAMLVYGPLTDRVNRKHLLIFGIGLFCAGTALAALAPNIEVLIIARVLQASGAAAGTVIARALAANFFKREELAEVYGYMNMCIVILPMFAPLIMGFMIDSYGWRAATWLFFAFGLLVLMGLPLVLRSAAIDHMQAPVKNGAPTQALSGFYALLSKPLFSSYLAVSATAQMGIFAFLAGAPYIFVEIFNRSASEYGLYFIPLTASYFVGSWASTRFSPQIGINKMILCAFAVFALGVLGLLSLYLLDALSVYPLFGFACLCAAANGAIQPNTSAGAMGQAGDELSGSAASLTAFALVISGAVGLQVMGFVQGTTALPMILVMLAMTCIGFVLIGWMFKQSRSELDPASLRQS